VHDGELPEKYQVSPTTRKDCTTKLGVMYL